MDNLTHSLVGLTAARAGLERLSPGATLLCVVAANAPDSDILVLLFGDRWDYLQNHRGITHALIGTTVLAFALPLIFYGIDWLWSRLRGRSQKTNLRGLLIASLIASATHPILDWTNSYGIRFLLPWNPRWFYGDLVFIVDPYLWIILGAPVVVFLFMKTTASKWGRKIALVSFAVVLAYWSLLAVIHARAAVRGREEAEKIASSRGESILRLATMPTLANPLRWDCVFETDRAMYRFQVTFNDKTPSGRMVRYPKPAGELAQALENVSQQKPARVLLGFARFPVARLANPDCTTQTLVQLADLRYTEPGNSRGVFGVELPVDCPQPALMGGR